MVGKMSRINIICETHGTTLERLRRRKRVYGQDLEAMKEITKYLHNEEFMNFTEIADILYRDRTTVRGYLNIG